MSSRKVLVVLNVSLGFVALLLLLSLFDVTLPSFGQAQYALEAREESCFVNVDDSLSSLEDVDRCCLEARKQLSCNAKQGIVDGTEINFECATASGVSYLLNTKAYLYCTQQPFW